MLPVSTAILIGSGLQLGGSLFGALSAKRAAAIARAKRQQLIMQATRDNSRALDDLRSGHTRDLLMLSGTSNDAIRSTGSAAGDAYSQAGLASSGVSGRLINEAQDRANASIIGAQRAASQDELNAANSFRQWLLGQQLGGANDDLSRAESNYGAAVGGLAEGIGGIASAWPGGKAPAKAAAVPGSGPVGSVPGFGGGLEGNLNNISLLGPGAMFPRADAAKVSMGNMVARNWRDVGNTSARDSGGFLNGYNGAKRGARMGDIKLGSRFNKWSRFSLSGE